MPERVWLKQDGMWGIVPGEMKADERTPIYVPESQLREAEAELAERFKTINAYAIKSDALIEENAAIRADLAALTPLARFGLGLAGSSDLTDDEIDAAHAVLARGDGA